MDPWNALIEFYVSIVSYFILHMIFVIASDFVDTFNITPLNVGIYVDKLAALRAFLMVLGDAIEYGCIDQAATDQGKAQKALTGGDKSPRRIGSILSFLAMLVCRIAYLVIIYKSDNKSFSVFIVLCIEGFWFGVFQMGFFAIGPEYNALTSLGIHTVGNFIFFFQLILEHYAKTRAKINPLYRVRVHGWICLVSSVLALCFWIYFCVAVTASGEDAPSQWPSDYDVLSPLLMFPVGSAMKDFLYPAILPFALLDNEKSGLINYLAPAFFMTGAILIVLFNDVIKKESKFKDWSASIAGGNAEKGMYWHALWALNIPKCISFLIVIWSIHGTFPRLRCIVQSRWRVMLLTIFIIIPRATLEVAGYVGVANYAIGRADLILGLLAPKLKKHGNITTPTPTASDLQTAINNQTEVKKAIASLVNLMYGATVADKSGGQEKDIDATDGAGGDNNKLKVKLQAADSGQGTGIADGDGEAQLEFTGGGNTGVTVTIKIERGKNGSLKTGENNNDDAAKAIANKLAQAVKIAPNAQEGAKQDFEAFAFIAVHDMLAMFCRFFYGKLAVGYNWT